MSVHPYPPAQFAGQVRVRHVQVYTAFRQLFQILHREKSRIREHPPGPLSAFSFHRLGQGHQPSMVGPFLTHARRYDPVILAHRYRGPVAHQKALPIAQHAAVGSALR